MQRPDGSVALAVATMLASGLFWALDESRGAQVLTVATDPGSVVGLRPCPSRLDPTWFPPYLDQAPAVDGTPYEGIRRIPPGSTLVVSATSPPRLVDWLGSSLDRRPHLSGTEAVAAFTKAFSAALEPCVDVAGPLTVGLSGGLDSTYLAAVLAARGAGGEVLGCVAAPVPGSMFTAPSGRLGDEYPLALVLGDASGGRIAVKDVRNTALVQPLDAADRASQRSWWPCFSPTNRVWLDQIDDVARSRRSSAVLVGTQGNWSFSPIFPRPVPPMVRARGRLRSGLARRYGRSRSPFDDQGSDPVRLLLGPGGAAMAPRRRPRLREWFLTGLGLRLSGFAAAGNPAALKHDLMHLDPFAARRVLEVAASITDETWAGEPWPRGFARRVMQGTVPDAIRLNTAKGAQAADAWTWIKDQRERYLDEAATLKSTNIVSDLVDQRHLVACLEAWPWGSAVGPGKRDVAQASMVLALANFIRLTEERLRALPDPQREARG